MKCTVLRKVELDTILCHGVNLNFGKLPRHSRSPISKLGNRVYGSEEPQCFTNLKNFPRYVKKNNIYDREGGSYGNTKNKRTFLEWVMKN